MSRRVAILGLGARGLRWAEACLHAGWDVSGFDPDDRVLLGEDAKGLRRQSTISATVNRADWVICCLPERLELIHMVLQRAQAEAPETTLVAVASRVHDVDALQDCALRPARIVRMDRDDRGGIVLDVSTKNNDDIRQAATAALSELAAAFCLVSDDGPNQPETIRREA